MAGKHLFEQVKPDRYRLIVHRAVPTGNNAVSQKWSDVLSHEGITGKTLLRPSIKTTVMVDSGKVDEFGDPIMIPETTETVEMGQISDAEKAQIDSGARFEAAGVVKLSGQPTQASLNKSATRMYNDWQAKMMNKYNLFGHTQA
ncbi:hypothetical protein LCGC14_1061880 [marine sediment metagenome]|uniref:Uncharacterized protein n=1 Tax=marine sediment metagenome TaxID=412755 RepID=A0A0F9MQG1_9ZZZZ